MPVGTEQPMPDHRLAVRNDAADLQRRVFLRQFLKLGRVTGDSNESFGLTPLALRMCRSTNGVSQKHGEVSRELWHKMWKDRSVEQVPITSLTNGVHTSTWVAPLLRRDTSLAHLVGRGAQR